MALIFVWCSGCGLYASLYESISGQDLARGNAIVITTEMPPDEAISGLQNYLKEQDFSMEAASGDELKTVPKTIAAVYASAGESEQDMRMRAVAEPNGSGSEIKVVAEYQVPATGAWERARVGDAYDMGSPAANALKKVENMLSQGYGGGSGRVERSSADFGYSGSLN